jgi:ankyrin repeat protein
MSTTLFDLIQRDELAALQRLLAANPGLARSRQESSGLGAVTFALYHHRFDAARALAAARTDLDWPEACGLGDLARLEHLLGQDPGLIRARTADGFTALHLACFFRSPSVVAWLIAHGADADAVADNPSLLRPLHSAAAGRDLACVEALLAAGAEVDARQNRGFVALHAAALHGDLPIVEALLRAGADASLRAEDGKDAAAFAREKGHTALERLLASQSEPA